MRYLVASLVSLAITGPALADAHYPLFPLLSSGKNVVGETIRYPTEGAARVTAAIVTLAPGASTVKHRHGVPMFAYILEGELTVDYGSHGKRRFVRGDSLLEAMDVAHAGINTGDIPVRILAVYMGADGARDVIPAE